MSALLPTGLQVDSLATIVANLTAQLQAIYGSTINVDSNSPDGQMINIFAQVVADQLEVLLALYNSFSVQTASGVNLDQRVALNGLARQAGTFTQTPVSVTVNQALNLVGQDQLAANPSALVYTVSDNAGNQYQLITSQTFGSSGTYVVEFQAVLIGAVQVLQNTITNQITVVLGVTSVNNPTAADVIGINEETDAQLRVRHAQSFSLAGAGSADALQSALLAVPGMLSALVLENDTGIRVNNINANSIWCIVKGSAALPANIAQAIYNKKPPGCGMQGSQSANVTRPNGTQLAMLYDIGITQYLYIRFTLVAKVAGTNFDHVAIANALSRALVYTMNQQASIGDVVAAMIAIAPGAFLTSTKVSNDNTNFVDLVTPNTQQFYYIVIASNITIS